jgi:hypothetical protein
MRKLLLAATFGVLAAAPAFAQEPIIGIGPNGVTVRPGVDQRYDRRYDERRFDERRMDRERYRERRVYRDYDEECRTVTTRIRRGDGSVVVRRERRCS